MKTKKSDSKPSSELKKIKSSMISRSWTLAKLTLGAGASLAGHKMAQTLATSKNQNSQQESWKNFLAQQAQVFSQEVGELKGSLMKAGQLLSVYGEHFFPPEVNQFLKTLQQDSPALAWSAIQPILQQELGPLLEQLEIEKTSMASASMGQVHKAKIIATQQVVALKVQYPNVDKAIDSDLKALQSFLKILNVLPQDKNLNSLFAEIKDMLVQETNYVLEAEMTQKFAQLLENDSRFIVPKVIPEFSTRKILCTSFESGLRLDDPIVQSLTQERRNRLAENFLDLYFQELFVWKRVQTDPHLGNYKVRLHPDGKDQIVLLDFGATREYESQFLTNYQNMIRGAVLPDISLFHQSAQQLGFTMDSDDPQLIQTFEDFCLDIVEPFLDPQNPRLQGRLLADGSYDWKKSDLPQRISKQVFHIMRTFPWRSPPREILFLDRKTGGIFILLGLLRAQIKARPMLLSYLRG